MHLSATTSEGYSIAVWATKVYLPSAIVNKLTPATSTYKGLHNYLLH